MLETSKDDSRLKQKLIQTVIPTLVNNLLRLGIITDNDLNNKEFVSRKIADYLKTAKDSAFEYVVDHRSTILEIAERENKNKNHDISIALYAIFIEHTLNSIIHIACINRKIDEKTQTEVLRNINLIGKCTWLLKLLELPPFKSDHIKTILSISDDRNSYFHYKWKNDRRFHVVHDMEKEERVHYEKIKKIKLVIKYLKSYETKQEYRGKKKKIIKASL